jgi:two-component system response regulator
MKMTQRPRTVSATGVLGRGGLPTLPTILLVDADEEARAMLRDALLEGARPTKLEAAAGAAELGARLELGAPSLVLVDLELPGDEALGIVRRLKEDPDLRRVPVVALTRRADPARVAEAYDAGANTVVPKPVTFLALVRLIKVFTAYWLEAAVLPGEPA